MTERANLRALNALLRKIRLRTVLLQRRWRTPSRRVLVLDLSSHFRFGPFLMAAFEGRGYSLEVVKRGAYVPDPRMLVRMKLGMASVPRPLVGHPGKTLIHDGAERHPSPTSGWGRVIRLDYDYYGDGARSHHAGDAIVSPYFMHPLVYESGLHHHVRGLRKAKRSIRVFFAGTVSEAGYERTYHWPYPSRSAVLDTVTRSFPESVEHVSPGLEYPTFLGRRHAIVLSIARSSADTVAKHVLTQRDMLEFAGSSDFFICPPGVKNPHSHNVIEAMATGAIPILAYGELFEPALEHLETCIAYRDLDDLVEKMRVVLAMPETQIRRMRASVCRYYDRHLAPETLFEKISSADRREVTLVMHNSRVHSYPGYVRLPQVGPDGVSA